MQQALVLRRGHAPRIVLRTLFDLPARELQVARVVNPAYFANPLWGYEHVFAVQPVARIDNEVTDGPRLFLKQEVRDMTYRIVGCLDTTAKHDFATSQVSVGTRATRVRSPAPFLFFTDLRIRGEIAGIAPHAQNVPDCQY